MCSSNIAKGGRKCPRHFFRLFDEQHMRRAWEHGKARRRDGVRYPLYDRGAAKICRVRPQCRSQEQHSRKATAACERRHGHTKRPPNHSDRSREVVCARLCPCRPRKKGLSTNDRGSPRVRQPCRCVAHRRRASARLHGSALSALRCRRRSSGISERRRLIWHRCRAGHGSRIEAPLVRRLSRSR